MLRPVLFNCVKAGLPPVLKSLGVQCHLCAADTQFTVTLERGDEM